jgi:hypothetical protein
MVNLFDISSQVAFTDWLVRHYEVERSDGNTVFDLLQGWNRAVGESRGGGGGSRKVAAAAQLRGYRLGGFWFGALRLLSSKLVKKEK